MFTWLLLGIKEQIIQQIIYGKSTCHSLLDIIFPCLKIKYIYLCWYFSNKLWFSYIFWYKKNVESKKTISY